MIVTICYFLKSLKSVFTLIQFSTSLDKNYVAHSITVVCTIGLTLKKPVCLHSRALSAYEISLGTKIFCEFAFDNKIKTFVEF